MEATVMLVIEGITGMTEEQSERVDEVMRATDVISAKARRLNHKAKICRVKKSFPWLIPFV